VGAHAIVPPACRKRDTQPLLQPCSSDIEIARGKNEVIRLDH
jgi:hypothetical protein